MNSNLLHLIYKLSISLHGYIFWVIQDAISQRDKTKELRNILEKGDSNVVLE